MTEDQLLFPGLQGQQQAKRLLRRVTESRRLAHAYLFRGPDGVGKRLCAYLFGAYLNCLEPTGSGACGRCRSCRKYLSGNHPDFFVVSPESGTIKIDRVRELCRSLSYPPYDSAMRVVVLEDVHLLRTEAANSLLKTLEEPPAQNLLILTAESSRTVLPTILSRCQIIPFYGLNDEQVKQVLQDKEPVLSDEEVRTLVRMAAGSPGLALRLRREGIVSLWQEVLTVLSGHVDEASRISAVLCCAERLSELKEHLVVLLDLMQIWVREGLLVQQQAGATAAVDGAWARLNAIDRARQRLARNCNRSLVCEVLLFDLQASVPGVSFKIHY